MKGIFITLCFTLLLYQSGAADTLTISHVRGSILPTEIPNLQVNEGQLQDSIWSFLWNQVEIQRVSGGQMDKRWYRFPILNDKEQLDTLYFVHDWGTSTYCFVFNENYQLVSVDTVGYRVNPDNRAFPEYPFIGRIPLAPGLSIVYFGHGIGGHYESHFTATLHDKTSIYQLLYREQKASGIQTLISTLSIGFMFFIFLFFLFYSFLVRERLYVYYVIYLLMALLFCLSMRNVLPSQAQVISNQLFHYRYLLNETAVSWMFAAYILFTDRLLSISPQNKGFGKLLKMIVVVLVIYGLWHFILKIFALYPDATDHSYFYFRIVFMPAYVLMLGYILLKISSNLKVFFMLASLSLLAGVISSTLVDLGPDMLNVGNAFIFPGALLQIGIMLEITFFSLALGYKNKLVHDQRDRNRRQYIEQLKENNKLVENEKNHLEIKISEARKEIIEKQHQIEARKIALLKSAYENKIQELTIQSLEAQMNPHFLFNGLSAVRDLVMKNNNRDATEYINTFALLLRNSLNNNRKHAITLREEMECTMHYLQIEKLRFGSGFLFSLDVGPDIDMEAIEVPPKLLQPVVENCVKHGLRHSSQSIKRINIKIFSSLDNVCILVEDNGIGLEASKRLNEANSMEVNHFGLRLLTDRLMVFNEQHDSHITYEIEEIKESQDEVLGTRVSVFIHYPSEMAEFMNHVRE